MSEFTADQATVHPAIGRRISLPGQHTDRRFGEHLPCKGLQVFAWEDDAALLEDALFPGNGGGSKGFDRPGRNAASSLTPAASASRPARSM
jgi:hypothetical protein